MDRIALAVGDQSFTLGPLADEASRSISFTPDQDASLRLCVGDGEDACADYGYVTHGLVQTHSFEVASDSVRYTFR